MHSAKEVFAMNALQERLKRLRQHRQLQEPAAASFTISLPNDLMQEVLSFLPVKSLIRLKCVNKLLNLLISDPIFIKMHLNKSSRNSNLTLLYTNMALCDEYVDLTFTYVNMLDNTPKIIALPKDPYHEVNDRDCRYVIGSCNGLLCLYYYNIYNGVWFRFWNPATRTLSDKLGFIPDGEQFDFMFGYDNLKDTFKVVHCIPKTTNVRVFSLDDNIWRNIQNSPVAKDPYNKQAVYFSDSLIWLVICNYSFRFYVCDDISIEQFVIISLDLRTETHTKLLTPEGFNEVPFIFPRLSVLNGCLCFSHDFKRSHFIIWQMKEFGVQGSWTQFLKISYQSLPQLQRGLNYRLLTLCLLGKNDILLLTEKLCGRSQAFLYNWRTNRVKMIDNPYSFKYNRDYVASLVSYR